MIRLGLDQVEECHSVDEQSARGSIRAKRPMVEEDARHMEGLRRSITSSYGNSSSQSIGAFSDSNKVKRRSSKNVTSSRQGSDLNNV